MHKQEEDPIKFDLPPSSLVVGGRDDSSDQDEDYNIYVSLKSPSNRYHLKGSIHFTDPYCTRSLKVCIVRTAKENIKNLRAVFEWFAKNGKGVVEQWKEEPSYCG